LTAVISSLLKGRVGSLFNFKIFETQDYLDHLEELLGKKLEAFNKKLQDYVYPQLRNQPYFGKNIKKLKACSQPTWRYRVGDIRLFYQVDSSGNIVLMTAAMLRKDSYRNA
jgi:mRNA interferase RelE/StbE